MFELFGIDGRFKYFCGVPMPSWLCYELSLKAWNRVSVFKANNKLSSKKNKKSSLGIFFKSILTDGFPSPAKITLLADDSVPTIALINTVNQYRAVSKLLPAGFKVISYNHEDYSDFSISESVKSEQLAFFGLKYFPLIVFEFLFTLDWYKRRCLIVFFKQYLIAYGLYRLYRENSFFKNKVIVYSNDHSIHTRALGLIKDRKFLAIYIPHANVSENFPPLEMDYAFLYGEDMKQKYQTTNEKIRIELIGNAYFDGLPRVSDAEIQKRKYVGVCVNLLDTYERVAPYLTELNEQGYQVLFRPHPADKRNWKDLLKDFRNMSYSDSKLENAVDFLFRIKVLISGASSILIEAWAVGVNSIQIDTSHEQLTDNYGLLKDKQLELVRTPSRLAECLKMMIEKPSTDQMYEKASFFYANVGQPVSAKEKFNRTLTEILRD